MEFIKDMAALEAIYPDPPLSTSLDKVYPHISPTYAKWIEAARFCIISTVGPEGTDSSPRGDDGAVVTILDAGTLALPDWHGNNRIDSLRNIVRDPRVSLMFMVPGSNNVVRVNGTAQITTDAALAGRFEKRGKLPRSVIVITVAEVYFQCAKALMRSGLWTRGDDSAAVPTAGEMIRQSDETLDAEAYDKGYAAYAAPKMW